MPQIRKVTNSSAQFFIRMKKLLVTLVALVCAVVGYAQQSTMVATLTHEETITSYYGTFAFQKAVEAAVSGDVITLSGGNFNAARSINKNITVRGTGMDIEIPTVINGEFTIEAPSEENKYLSFEGVKFFNKINFNGTGKVSINKCDIACSDHSPSYSSGIHEECTYTNCIMNDIYMDDNVRLINCIVHLHRTGSNTVTFVNCVINYYMYPYYWHNLSFTNCILINNSSRDYSFNSDCNINYCLHIGRGDVFNIIDTTTPIGSNNVTGLTLDIFEDSDWTKPLTSDAKELYKGNDEISERGIYGGFLPWSSTPYYPQITKLNISNRTTSDGQLSVDVEVNSVQQQ